jgi:hypothetical protein
MMDENVDKRERERERGSKLLSCSVTVAQIKISYTSIASGTVGDLSRVQASKNTSTESYLQRAVYYNETLHNIKTRIPRSEKLLATRSQQSLLASTRPDHMGIVPLSAHLSKSIIVSYRATHYRAGESLHQRNPSYFPSRQPGHIPTSTDPHLRNV